MAVQGLIMEHIMNIDKRFVKGGAPLRPLAMM
jgi:hypothetical protein